MVLGAGNTPSTFSCTEHALQGNYWALLPEPGRSGDGRSRLQQGSSMDSAPRIPRLARPASSRICSLSPAVPCEVHLGNSPVLTVGTATPCFIVSSCRVTLLAGCSQSASEMLTMTFPPLPSNCTVSFLYHFQIWRGLTVRIIQTLIIHFSLYIQT